jgi:dTDP-4-amino-4,6-dideoxygalactose transaminase
MSDWRIALSDLDYGPEEEAAVLRVLKSKWLSMGPEVQAFEKEFGELVGAKYALAVSNGTAALHLSYLALGLGPGGEIIQPAVNFVAAANMTVAVGSTPVFADIAAVDEPTIDPKEIERRITPRTKAVVVMHYGGYLCRMAEIKEICERKGLFLIEDACHAVGAQYLDPRGKPPHKKMAGAIGDIACFSFFSNKNIAIGEGGMVVTNRDDLAERLRLLRSHGMTTLTWDRHKGHARSYDVILNGYNYRLDELRAALGRSQLAKLEKNNERRRELVSVYRKNLSSLPGWVIPFGAYSGDSACHLMVAVAPTEEVRLKTVENLNKNRIQTSLHYPFLPEMSAFKDRRWAKLARSVSFVSRVITLPLFPTLNLQQVEEICANIAHAQG